MAAAIRKDLMGLKFGELLVVEHLGRRTRNPGSADIWLCRCKCGKTTKSTSYSLLECGKSSCGCLRSENAAVGVRKALWKGIGQLSGSWWGWLKKDARRRNITVAVTFRHVADLFTKQKGKCAISGLPIDTNSSGLRGTASLDRIDNSKGYVRGNLWWVHKDINKMKNTHELDYFINLCHTVSDFQR